MFGGGVLDMFDFLKNDVFCDQWLLIYKQICIICLSFIFLYYVIFLFKIVYLYLKKNIVK